MSCMQYILYTLICFSCKCSWKVLHLESVLQPSIKIQDCNPYLLFKSMVITRDSLFKLLKWSPMLQYLKWNLVSFLKIVTFCFYIKQFLLTFHYNSFTYELFKLSKLTWDKHWFNNKLKPEEDSSSSCLFVYSLCVSFFLFNAKCTNFSVAKPPGRGRVKNVPF